MCGRLPNDESSQRFVREAFENLPQQDDEDFRQAMLECPLLKDELKMMADKLRP